jgi:hypothetical protein
MKSFFLVLFCIAFVSGQSYIKTKVFSEPDCLTDTGAFLSHSVADGVGQYFGTKFFKLINVGFT